MRAERMRARSQIGTNFETGGNVFIMPFSNFAVVGWVKTKHTYAGGWKALMAAKCPHRELRDKPNIFIERRYSSMRRVPDALGGKWCC